MTQSHPSQATPTPSAGADRRTLVSRVAFLAATTMSTAAVLLPAPQPLQAVGGIALTAYLPGAAVARRLLSTEPSWPPDQLLRAVVAVVLSMAFMVAASLGLLYLEQWSWQRVVLMLAAVATVAAMPDVLPGRWRWHRSA